MKTEEKYLLKTVAFSFGSVTRLFLPLDEAIASTAVLVIVSGSDGRSGGRTGGGRA